MNVYQLTGNYTFPKGIPGFEDLRTFGVINMPGVNPEGKLIGLISGSNLFVCMNCCDHDPTFKDTLLLSDEEKLIIDNQNKDDLFCLCLITITPDRGLCVNLGSPIIIDVKSKKGIQLDLVNNLDVIIEPDTIEGLSELAKYKLGVRSTNLV